MGRALVFSLGLRQSWKLRTMCWAPQATSGYLSWDTHQHLGLQTHQLRDTWPSPWSEVFCSLWNVLELLPALGTYQLQALASQLPVVLLQLLCLLSQLLVVSGDLFLSLDQVTVGQRLHSQLWTHNSKAGLAGSCHHGGEGRGLAFTQIKTGVALY